MKNPAIKKYKHILYGGDYNPEQWRDNADVLLEDTRLMKHANYNEITLGIFSWSILEPEEGVYDFAFFDKIMDDAYAAGIKVILATPSAARPVWLAEKYPEVCRVSEDGIRSHFGGRHNHCNNSPVYREKVRIINEKIASRYKNHPALLAWHISNEYGNSTDVAECHCEHCKSEFRKWLKNKYGSIEKLNSEWWTTFWSGRYSDWEQIEPPSKLTGMNVHGRNLDWKRFVSDKTIEFMNVEIVPLRKITPDVPITTNLMGYFDGIDYRKLAQSIDFVSFDSYPKWRSERNENISVALNVAMEHDLMRSLKQKPFLLMESTPSCVNWHPYNKLLRPGMLELSSLQVISHGSDSVQFFQWRKSRGGSEKLHGAVIDHCGDENTRVFKEVKHLGARLQNLDDVVGTVTVSEVAILHDWENKWALEDCQGFSNDGRKYMQTLQNFYKPLWKCGINTDIIGKDDDFDKYKLIIAPMLYMICDTLKQKICEYVRKGGTFVGTYMTGMVNENDLCHLGKWPYGELKNVFGIWNEEIDVLYPDEKNTVRLNNGDIVNAVDYCEIIHNDGAETLAAYDSDFYKGYSAFTENIYGKGKAYYIAFRDKGDFTEKAINYILNKIGVNTCFDGKLPDGVTAHSRTDMETEYVFIENYNDFETEVKTDLEWSNIETGEMHKHKITLPAYSIKILKKQ